jgi:hypothetical protein
MRYVKHTAYIEQLRSAHKVLVRKAERKRSVRKPRHRWACTIKMELKEIR